MGTRGKIKYMLDTQSMLSMTKKLYLIFKFMRNSRLPQEPKHTLFSLLKLLLFYFHSIFSSKTSKIVSALAACNAERIDDSLKQKRRIEG